VGIFLAQGRKGAEPQRGFRREKYSVISDRQAPEDGVSRIKSACNEKKREF
jgi:hypothetical protein